MAKIKAVIGDNSDESYSKEIEAEISNVDYLIYKDCMSTCSSDEYDKAWDRICDAISSQNTLPHNWYIDTIY